MKEEYYITTHGDTWDKIAKEVYNDETKAGILMEYNFDYIDTFIFDSGVEIFVPELEEEKEDELPDWRMDDGEDDE